MSKDYWNWAESHAGAGDHMLEYTEANPDTLPDTTNIFVQKSVLSDGQEEALASYYRLVAEGVLGNLSPMQKQIWKLKFFKWMTNEEIAGQLEITPQAIQSHLNRAGQKIKVEVEKDLRRKEIREGNYFKSGFKKRIHTVGQTKTDAEFEKRIERHQTEIDTFLTKHPELRGGGEI